MELLLRASNAINKVMDKIATAFGWLFLALTAVIVFDVLSRNFGFQLPRMGSTRLQELEWHIHTALFCFWLGFAYIKNAHVRIDVAFTNAEPRTKAWAELLGCVIFALPYTLVALYFSADFTWISFVTTRDRRRQRAALAMDTEVVHYLRAAAAAVRGGFGDAARDRAPVRTGSTAGTQ
jgi:TRAP-type mannitol/chloroaromatic compound transport system permease small subunit